MMPNETVRPKLRALFEITSTLAMLGLAGVLVWQGWASAEASRTPAPPGPAALSVPSEPVSIAGANVLGSPTAKLAMIEFADFECGACASFVDRVKPDLIKEYVDTGRVLFVFMNFPLQRHLRAPSMAAAATCAGRQGKFWQMHDTLFASPDKSADEDLRRAAAQLDLDLKQFDACFGDPQSIADVESARALAKELKITGTPAFLFGSVLADQRVQIIEGTLGTDLDRARETLNRLLK
jgi:protein-disulfide isomerase